MQFVAIDGESLNDNYCLLGTNTDSFIESLNGLSTVECLDFLLSLKPKRNVKETTFIWFVGHYDINMMLRDIPASVKQHIWNTEKVLWGDYKIQYFHRKIFILSKKNKAGKFQESITIYDVWGFFQSSFLAGVEKFLGDAPEVLKWGKQARVGFTVDDFNGGKVREYNKLECVLLVEMMDKLKGWLVELGYDLTKWYGSSALANQVLKQWEVRNDFYGYYQNTTQESLWNAWHYGYFGGRIEAIKLGYFGDIYNYDINSAYPTAAAQLPILTKAGWRYTKRFLPEEKFAIYRIEWNFPKSFPIGLLPFRASNKTIYFPQSGAGWYWSPEVAHCVKHYPEYIKIKEGWFHKYEPSRLALEIPAMYNKRLELKQAGKPAEYAIKLALNSIYGKFAQRVGKAHYRCLAWAGWITSRTRATLLEAIKGYEHTIIGFATDGILSTEPLPLEATKLLGGWDVSHWQEGFFLMSGVYHLVGKDDKIKNGNRGYKQMDWSEVIDQLNQTGTAKIQANVFVSSKLASTYKKEFGKYELKFKTIEKVLNPANLDKRIYHLEQISQWNKDHCESDIADIARGQFSAPCPQREEPLHAIFDSNEFLFDEI